MIFWFFKIFFSIPIRILYPTKILGKKNFPKKGGAIEICNHRKLFDPVIVAVVQRRRVRFLAKIELFKTFIGKIFFKGLGAIPVDRNKLSFSSMKNVVKVIKKGKIILIFPEGRRNKSGDNLQEFKNGIALFSIMAKAPVIPIYMLKKPKMFRRNYLIAGEPVSLEQFYDKKPGPEVLAEANKIITSKMQNLQDELTAYYAQKKSKNNKAVIEDGNNNS